MMIRHGHEGMDNEVTLMERNNPLSDVYILPRDIKRRVEIWTFHFNETSRSQKTR